MQVFTQKTNLPAFTRYKVRYIHDMYFSHICHFRPMTQPNPRVNPTHGQLCARDFEIAEWLIIVIFRWIWLPSIDAPLYLSIVFSLQNSLAKFRLSYPHRRRDSNYSMCWDTAVINLTEKYYCHFPNYFACLKSSGDFYINDCILPSATSSRPGCHTVTWPKTYEQHDSKSSSAGKHDLAHFWHQRTHSCFYCLCTTYTRIQFSRVVVKM